MGALLSRFRKKPTTIEQLKKIEDSIRKIEDYKRVTERKQKRTIANVIIYGTCLYVLSIVFVFMWDLPESWLVRMGLIIPLILVPVFIYWMKRIIARYFQNKMARANEDFADLQRKKTEIIDNLMDTETYNKAKEILLKYAPEKLEKKLQERVVPPQERMILPPSTKSMKTSTTDLRKRNSAISSTSTTDLKMRTNSTAAISTSTTTLRPGMSPPGCPGSLGPDVAYPPNPNCIDLTIERIMKRSTGPIAPLPQPLFPKRRSFSERIVEYIVGDGPGYRYALICKFCAGHNGMALKEEFPFMSYTCCYCMRHNIARTQKRLSPRLAGIPEAQASPANALGITPLQTSDGAQENPAYKVIKLGGKDSKSSVTSDDFPSPVPFDEFIKQLETQASKPNGQNLPPDYEIAEFDDEDIPPVPIFEPIVTESEEYLAGLVQAEILKEGKTKLKDVEKKYLETELMKDVKEKMDEITKKVEEMGLENEVKEEAEEEGREEVQMDNKTE